MSGTDNCRDRGLTYGMIGGGVGSFIGSVHRKSLALNGGTRLACGCFDIVWENNLLIGRQNSVEEGRIYPDYLKMLEAEAAREDRIDFIAIATPNNLHYSIARACLEHGFHVVCEKPMCFELEEAYELKRLAEEKNLLFCVCYSYIGYPMVKQARKMIEDGAIGDITVVMAEYAQQWVAERVQESGGKPSFWRNDPKVSGGSLCVGDIGTHVECTVSYMTGLKIEKLCASLRSIGEGIGLDSNAEILVKYKGGASAIYWCSQVAVGIGNCFRIRVFGTKGSLDWTHENPGELKYASLGRPTQTLVQGKKYIDPSVLKYCRIPASHPEGFIEAFANNYIAFTEALMKVRMGVSPSQKEMDFAGVDEGISGVNFIRRCLESSAHNGVWVNFRD